MDPFWLTPKRFSTCGNKVVKHFQIGLAIDVLVKKVWPNEVVPKPDSQLFSRRGFVIDKCLQVAHHGLHNGRRCG